ncbi:MAG TPA: hypothetical protein VJX67_08180 [Blastocatellia bacterium]|nr:hypothetical protein [Blastocatellia bacterium]
MSFVKFPVLALFLCVVFTLAPVGNAQSTDRAAVEKDIESLRSQIAEKEVLFLSPSPEDQVKYERFLQQPESGLCRLMPREKFDRVLTVRGGGSYYSFVKLTHEYGYGTEIGLEQGTFYTVFAGANLGLITSLGDLSIEAVDLKHPAADFLANYIVPEAEPDARAEYMRIMKGIEGGGSVFRLSVPAKTNTTYVMRSIDYNNSDVLAVFRVVGQDPDGSLTILWRILLRVPTPKLIQTEPR